MLARRAPRSRAGKSAGIGMKPPSPCTGSSTTQATVAGSTSPLNRCSSAASASSRRDALVRVRRRRAVHLGRERPEARLVRLDLARHRHRQQRAAVERVVEDDDGGTTGGSARDLDRVLHRLRAGVDEDRLLLGARARRELGEAPAHLDVRLVDPDHEALVEIVGRPARGWRRRPARSGDRCSGSRSHRRSRGTCARRRR